METSGDYLALWIGLLGLGGVFSPSVGMDGSGFGWMDGWVDGICLEVYVCMYVWMYGSIIGFGIIVLYCIVL